MNKYIILLLLMCFARSIMAQTNEENDSVLVGRTGPNVVRLFPFINDSILYKRINYPIIYPLLIVNNEPIRDEKKLDCFRNHFDRTQIKIKKIKMLSQAKAAKKGIPNVPKDGVLFITTKKSYYFDFSCEEILEQKK